MPSALLSLAFPAFMSTTTGMIIGGAANIAASMALNALFAPKPPSRKPEDVQGLIRQSVAARMRHYGRVRVGGHIVFIEMRLGALYQLIVHGQGPITAYHATYLDNRAVELEAGANGGVVTAPYTPTHQIIDSQFGVPGISGWGRLNTDFPEIWGVNHRCEGLAASLLYTATVDEDKVQEVYPNRISVLNRVIDGAPCFDPRTSSVGWTPNAALILRDYLTHPDGMNIPGWLIDDTLFAAAANVCDEPVALRGGGTLPRYPIGLSYGFEEEPKDVINRIVTACDGRLFLTSSGQIGFQAGKWEAPTVTISDEAGHIIHADMRDGSGPFREANEIIVKYTMPEVGYKEATCDPWRDEASISEIGTRSTLITAYEIQYHNHARRIAKIAQRRASPRWQGTVVCNLHGLNAWDQRWINLILPDYDIDETFEIVGPPSLDTREMTVTLQVASFGPDAYAFNPTTEEGTGPTVPDEIAAETIPAPTVNTNVVIRTLGEVEFNDHVWDPVTETNDEQQQRQEVQVYVAVIWWPAPPRDGLSADAQYSLNGTDWIAMAVSPDGLGAETPPMPRGATVRLRARFRTLGGAVSDWVNGSNVVIPPIAP